jgi:hypothetical protein
MTTIGRCANVSAMIVVVAMISAAGTDHCRATTGYCLWLLLGCPDSGMLKRRCDRVASGIKAESRELVVGAIHVGGPTTGWAAVNPKVI